MRMLPLMYRALVDAGVDDEDLPRLKGVVRRTWYDNLVLFHAVGSALDALEAAGIPAMLLKGVPLALQCYPEVGLRPMADVDMLVEPWRAADAIEVLGGAGWPTESKVTVPDALPYGEQMVHQVVCANEANRQIDLHWRYVPWIARDGSGYDPGLWSAARPFDVAGHTALSPGPDDLLLLVLLHAFRGGWAATPRWIADATLMLRARGRSSTGSASPIASPRDTWHCPSAKRSSSSPTSSTRRSRPPRSPHSRARVCRRGRVTAITSRRARSRASAGPSSVSSTTPAPVGRAGASTSRRRR